MILEVFSDVCDSMILYWCNMAGQRVAHIASYSRESAGGSSPQKQCTALGSYRG